MNFCRTRPRWTHFLTVLTSKQQGVLREFQIPTIFPTAWHLDSSFPVLFGLPEPQRLGMKPVRIKLSSLPQYCSHSSGLHGNCNKSLCAFRLPGCVRHSTVHSHTSRVLVTKATEGAKSTGFDWFGLFKPATQADAAGSVLPKQSGQPQLFMDKQITTAYAVLCVNS